jgi:predicted MFS family arabinose efflux permease
VSETASLPEPTPAAAAPAPAPAPEREEAQPERSSRLTFNMNVEVAWERRPRRARKRRASGDRNAKALAGPIRPSGAMLTTVVTGGMAFGQQYLFVLSALAPFIVTDLALSRSTFGTLITFSYIATVGLSLLTGGLVDAFGGRRGLAVLLLVVPASVLIASLATNYAVLVAAAAAAGVGQALSLPSTNKLVAAHVPSSQQSAAIGIKQSGVQIGALVAGLVLPWLAAWFGWRGALRLLTLAPLALLPVLLWVVPLDPPAPPARRLVRLPGRPASLTRWLMAYSICLGSGTAATNSFLPLYAHDALHLSEAGAGVVLAVVGISGVLARIVWTMVSDRMDDASVALVVLAVAAVAFALVVWEAERLGVVVLWLGALGLGASAVAGNAVSTLIVVRESGLRRMGEVSALVGMSFFAGFVVSPPLFGALADVTGGYGAGWLMVAGLFAAAAGVAAAFHRVRAQLATTSSL